MTANTTLYHLTIILKQIQNWQQNTGDIHLSLNTSNKTKSNIIKLHYHQMIKISLHSSIPHQEWQDQGWRHYPLSQNQSRRNHKERPNILLQENQNVTMLRKIHSYCLTHRKYLIITNCIISRIINKYYLHFNL